MAFKERWQKQENVCNIIAKHLEDLIPMSGAVAAKSRDFR